MANSRSLLLCALAGLLLAGAVLAATASAQYIQIYFPRGVPGFGSERGVTVLTRQRPDYDDEAERVGSFIVEPTITESAGFDSNVASSGKASPVLRTNPAVSITSDWGRDRLGAAFSIDDYRALAQPSQNQTNWTVSIGGAKAIDLGDLNLGYAHLSLHENATDFGAVPADAPIAFSVDDLRADYTFKLGRLSLTPNADLRAFSFGGTTVQGVPVPQAYRDRIVTQAGVTARYALSEQRNLVLVASGLDSHYTQPQPGQPSNNSHSALLLGGIDYLDDGLLRYQLLAGAEVRAFEAAAYGTRVAPVAEARVIWSPTALTTVTATLTREIEDPSAEGTGGYTYTSGRLVVDHDYAPDIVVQARGGIELAHYLHAGGSQAAAFVGATATWLVDRNLRLALSYDVSDRGPSGNDAVATTRSLSGATAGAYTRSLALLTLRFGL